MSASLPGIMDYIVTLLEATASGVTRSIPGGGRVRFKHTPSGLDDKLSMAARAPYPFEVVDAGRVQTRELTTTLSGDQIFDARRLLVRVGYASAPHKHLERLKTMQADDYSIRRTLSHQRSWDGASTVSVVTLDDGSIEPEGVERADGEPDVMWVVGVPITVDYREDHTDE